MRLWTLDPRYLDAKGLVAAWREALLAQAVLEGRTVGYARHPQLERFRRAPDPAASLGRFLEALAGEAGARGYTFDASKIHGLDRPDPAPLPVTLGQVAYELELLRSKLNARDPELATGLPASVPVALNPVFVSTPGPVESWERVRPDVAR
ncbi:MAG TPA: pyrimidine dimer DNA glycosylase/endonuclease V [Spirochaetales bacterium]|nr:pyrimidine dimer DNA glycosylase/endonuclease V [Spirochaetales bacterium]HPB65069.1 pyrimidine dimer DNA glycosylase/endonuclease V [Spirochaetales bacterium]HPG87786.1 pyrimidine dimer DNA glycosylase/endonuclease V [Spirochaetales bacterium]HPM72476.1 pyrimidine dimer DNA glycosylase/endonuclease V [Spirochaetales bacterium]